MFKLISTIVVIGPLLAGCETTDWMAEPDEYSPAYSTSEYDPNASYDQFMEHQRAVNRENCAAAAEGRDRVCYD